MSTIVQFELWRTSKENVMHLWVSPETFFLCSWVMLWDTYSRPEPWRRGTVFPGLTRAVPHHLTVDGTADTVVQLHVELGQHIRCNRKGRQDRKLPCEMGCGNPWGKCVTTYSQRHWPPRCPSQPLPPRCFWWQTSWWPCPWGHNGHSWCSGWAAHGHGPSWHDRYSSFSWSIKFRYQRQITTHLPNKPLLTGLKKTQHLG